ncbi:TetR family transcriptional regulator C-terminal domain-containing protein, partial [Mixta calida]|uniref:TetR family transcriptional regulator C-terminal domain-containing protein n=1 Tax=Mixta calida TaxID=665913 RepID=UPI0028A97969
LVDIFLTPEGHAVAVLRAEIASEGARNAHVAELLRDSESGLINSVQNLIRAAQQSGQVSGELNPEAVTARLSLVFEGLMRLYLFSPANGQKLIEQYYLQFADTLQLSS